MKDYKHIEHMRNLNDSLIWERMKRCYDYGYEDGKADTPFTDTEEAEKKAYERGLNDAWECARKMCCMEPEERLLAFDVSGNHLAILSDLTAPKAMEKLKAYEEKQKQTEDIKVGDEVTHDGAKFIVLNIDSQTSVYCLDTRGRTPIFTNIHNLTKTGRHFDTIPEVLKQMNREEGDKE